MKLKIYTHSGEEYPVEIENYDATEIHRQRNDPEVLSILFGNHDLSRINIRDIVPIEEPVIEEPETIEEPAENDEEKQ